jgi:hypothetical protein
VVAALAIVSGVMFTQSRAAPENAPSYEEIHKAMQAIIHTENRPNGPAVSSDGITDEEFLREWKAYDASLQGKKISSWVGCLTGIEQPLQNVRGDTFNIEMDEAEVGVKDAFSDVVLTSLTTLNKGELTSTDSGDTTQKSCSRIKFSGIIETIDTGGRLYVNQGTIAPVK